MNRALTVTITLGQSGPGSNCNKGYLTFPKLHVRSPSMRCSLVSYPGHSLVLLRMIDRPIFYTVRAQDTTKASYGISMFYAYIAFAIQSPLTTGCFNA